MRKKFARLRGLLVKLVVAEDAFGLRERKPYKVVNSFCPTGEGGGVDPTCSPKYQEDKAEYSGKIQIVFKEGKKEVGEITLQPRADGNFEVGNILVWPGFQKKGHATNFYRRAFEEASSRGKKLYISDDRTDDAKALHAKFKSRSILKSDGQIVFNSQKKPIANRFQFHSSPDKVLEFQKWLRLQFKSILLGKSDEELWAEFARRGYEKGAGRAFEDVNKKTRWKPGEGDFYGRSKQEFLKSSFGRAESTDKLRLLASRSFTDLRNVTEDMATRMGRTLMDGLARGANPRELVDGLMDDLEVSEVRAESIARTEIIRAHAEGQLDAMEKLGVEEVGVAVEWDTAKDGRVCPRCRPLQGVVLSIQEAHGLIPNHVNCRCAFVPANIGEDTSKQLRTKQEILDAFEEADVDPPELDEKRPEPLVEPTKNELHEFSRLVRSL